uniref:Uncharacterized protein n=1 Tax=Arundo donax TaxID=35708 RepID=A0A0A9AIT7_ARUDO
MQFFNWYYTTNNWKFAPLGAFYLST